jgi:S1-C subfamily serine protease
MSQLETDMAVRSIIGSDRTALRPFSLLFIMQTVLTFLILAFFQAATFADEKASASDPGITRKSAKEIFDLAKPAVVQIATFDGHGAPLAMGSGFFIQSNTIVTCFHVLKDSASATVTLLDSSESNPITSVLYHDADNDVAIVSVASPSTKFLTLNKIEQPAIGEKVFVLGNPKGFSGTFSDGIVSALRNDVGKKLIQITAPISPGSSGGPLLSEDGSVIGVVRSTIRNAQNLNFATPVAAIRTSESSAKPFVEVFGAKASATPTPLSNTNGAVTIEGLAWAFKYTGTAMPVEPVSFSVVNNTGFAVRDVFISMTFLNAEDRPIDTKYISVPGFIGSRNAKRVESNVSGNIRHEYMKGGVNLMPPLMLDEGTYMIGTNKVVKTHKPIFLGAGRKSIHYQINGKPATDKQISQLRDEEASRVREAHSRRLIVRVLNYSLVE